MLFLGGLVYCVDCSCEARIRWFIVTDTDTRRKLVRHRFKRIVLGQTRPNDRTRKNDTTQKRRNGGDTAIRRWNGKI